MQRLSKDEIERSFDDEVDPELEREIDEVRQGQYVKIDWPITTRSMVIGVLKGESILVEYRNGCPILSDAE